jgi:pyruvate carboxylase
MKTALACTGRVRHMWFPFSYIVSIADDISIEADEAYVIGKRGQYTPVGAYLAADEIVKIALQHDVNMIHPG